MLAARLPGYVALPPHSLSPAHTVRPQENELHLIFDPQLRPNGPPRSFVKQTKGGNVSLRLVDQDVRVEVPVYGLGASIQGIVEISKTEGVTSVEAKAEGILRLEEIAEGGTSTHRLFSKKSILWIKDRVRDLPCPNSLRFSFLLPTTYTDKDKTYLLPPSFEAHLSGLPGFRAYVSYSVSTVVIKPNDVSNMVKSTLLRKDGWTVSTPFLYHPRTCPSVPIPIPLVASAASNGFTETPQWKLFSSTIMASQRGTHDLVAKLYIPTGQIFCIRQPIPFHLSFHSDTSSLLAFLPFAPAAGLISPRRQVTRIQLMRQTTVNARNSIIFDTKPDIWRVDCIGEGAFRNAGHGVNWAAFSGDIFISDEVTIGGFRASGFSIRDCLVLTMTPPEFFKSPFKELRMVVPIRLATDRWTSDGTDSELYSPSAISSTEELDAAPELPYAPYLT